MARRCSQKAADLHDRISKIKSQLEADLLLMEHEAKLVKNKIF